MKNVGFIKIFISDKLPWGLNLIVLPISLLFLIFIFCISLSFITGTSFELNFFKLINFKFGNKNKKPEMDKLRVEFDVNHRNFIQDVPANSPKLKSIKNAKASKSEEDKPPKVVEEVDTSIDAKDVVNEKTTRQKEFVACSLKKRKHVLENKEKSNSGNNNCDEEVEKIKKEL